MKVNQIPNKQDMSVSSYLFKKKKKKAKNIISIKL